MVETFARVVVLGLTCVAALAAALALAPKLSNPRSMSERWLTALIVAHVLPLGGWWVVSWFGLFTDGWAQAAALLVTGAALAWAPKRHLARRLGLEGRRLLTMWRGAAESLPTAYIAAAAAFALATSVVQVLTFSSWSWDCVWYHGAQSRLMVQNHSIHYWVDTHNPYLNSYPRLVETFSAFTILALQSSVLDDSTQLAWGAVGALAVTAWCRRLGAQRVLSLALGLCWLVLPAVFLQLHTTHADVAAGSLFLALAYFTFAPLTPKSLAMSLVSAALLFACKMSAFVLVPLMAPWLGWAVFRQGRALRRGAAVALVVTSLAVGLTGPLRNFARTHNPLYPAWVRLPVLDVELPGVVDEDAVAGGRAFLRSPDSVKNLVERWYREPGEPYPDIRERPFGRAGNDLVFPLGALGLVVLIARRQKLAAVQLAYTAFAALMVPAAWWGRFVLGVPGAALVAAGAFFTWLERKGGAGRGLYLVGLATLATLTVWDLGAHFIGFRTTPTLGAPLWVNEKALRRDKSWLWSPELLALREAEMSAGDLLVYDQTVQFLAELWNSAATSRVEYLDSSHAQAFCDRVDTAGAKWVAVEGASAAEAELLRRHPQASRVGVLPMTSAALYRLPRTNTPTSSNGGERLETARF